MNKKLVNPSILCALLFISFTIPSSFAVTGWNKEYSLEGYNQAQCVVQTTDNGYILAGFANTSSNGLDARVIKTDEAGNIQWEKLFGGQKDDKACSIIQIDDGSYVFVGGTEGNDSISYYVTWQVKLDESGNMVWQKSDFNAGAAYSVIEVDDGFIIGTQRQLIKVDVTGDIVWRAPLSWDMLAAAKTSDGGFVITGECYFTQYGGYQAYIAKYDYSGNQSFNQTIFNSSNGWSRTITQTADGGFIFAGNILDAPNPDGSRHILVWLVKTNQTGHVQWERTFDHLGDDFSCGGEAHSVIQTQDGGYALVAETSAFYFLSNSSYHGPFWLIKTDSDGNMLWDRLFQGSGGLNVPYSLVETADGGFAIAGVSGNALKYSSLYSSGDFWLIKTDENGNTPGLSVPELSVPLLFSLLSMSLIIVMILSLRRGKQLRV